MLPNDSTGSERNSLNSSFYRIRRVPHPIARVRRVGTLSLSLACAGFACTFWTLTWDPISKPCPAERSEATGERSRRTPCSPTTPLAQRGILSIQVLWESTLTTITVNPDHPD